MSQMYLYIQTSMKCYRQGAERTKWPDPKEIEFAVEVVNPIEEWCSRDHPTCTRRQSLA